MKIEYKILWFEDQFEAVSGFRDELIDYISEYGFKPTVESRTSITKLEIEELSDRLSSYNPYDLIIFDNDLGSRSESGISIAGHLRRKIFTDMVVYSGQNPEGLRQDLCDGHVDGVFIVHRDYFSDDIQPIVEDHIKKMSDLNNMRGVVMSETSVMDSNLREILVSKSKEIDTDVYNAALVRFKERLVRKLKDRVGTIENITRIEVLVEDHILTTFDNIRILLRELYEDLGNEVLKDGLLVHNVQVERNKLAHCKCTLTDDGHMILEGMDYQKEYDFDEFKRLRNDLLLAHKDIEKLR